MKLTILLKQLRKKPRTLETHVDGDAMTLELMRGILEAERVLNAIPGTNLVVRIDIVGEQVK